MCWHAGGPDLGQHGAAHGEALREHRSIRQAIFQADSDGGYQRSRQRCYDVDGMVYMYCMYVCSVIESMYLSQYSL